MATSSTKTEPEENVQGTDERILEWEKKLRVCESEYQPILAEIEDNYEAYKGTRAIKNSKGSNSKQDKTTVRKVTFELVEAQVDVNIPQPKVISRRGNYDRAQVIEYYLKNELERLPFEEMNDEQCRTTPIAGGSLFMVEWDNSVRTRNTIGNLVVKHIQPSEFVPQRGVYKIQEMDYCFLKLLQSKDSILQKYGIDVRSEDNTEADNDETNNDELVTHYYCFYRNEHGNISLFSWVDSTVVQDIDDYFARKERRCKKCDKSMNGISTCECGSTESKLVNLQNQKVKIPVIKTDPLTGAQTVAEEIVDVEHYVPKKFPFVVRKNVSETDRVLGGSDVEAIKDQQNDLNIYTNKIREKLLKGGSIVLVPESVNFKATNDEMKIQKIKTPAEKALFDVKNIQANVNNDMILLDKTYDIARQTIGITDSFQGRRDTTALSGKAKEFAAQQTAGRFESKRVMKEFAFGELFELMFQFLLAYSDEPRYYHFEDEEGNLKYKLFDKKLFLEKTKDGKYYYDDDFIFGNDESAMLSTNRRAMWEETRLNFTSGSYGDPKDLKTIVMFWQTMDALHYPGAKRALKFATERVEEQRAAQEAAAQAAGEAAEKDRAVKAFGEMNKGVANANKNIQQPVQNR